MSTPSHTEMFRMTVTYSLYAPVLLFFMPHTQTAAMHHLARSLPAFTGLPEYVAGHMVRQL